MFNVYRNRRPRPATTMVFVATIWIAVTMVASGVGYRAYSATDRQSPSPSASTSRTVADTPYVPRLVQDSDDSADSEVPPDQVEKYIAVYKDMQRDRALTVDAAAAKEGLSVTQFRQLEEKIERNEAAREHVRTELQGAVGEKP